MNLPTGLHLYNPLVYTSCLLAEIHTHLDDFPSVCRKGSGIAFLFDLPHGFFGRSLQFELHDIDVVGGFQYEIHPSPCGTVFHFGMESHQLENNVQDVLVMHFPVACQFVGGVVEEGAQAVQETVYIPLATSPTKRWIS